jgi:lipopolysaccharide transport system permease protein
MTDIAETVIKPQKGWRVLDFSELWRFRGILYFLTWRDVKVKYKQSLLGISWVMFKPVLTMAIFSVLFGRWAAFPSEGTPYPIFVFLGLLPWTYFSTSVTHSTASLVGSANLISKVYFPRILIPISANLSNLLDLFVSLAVLLILMLYYGIRPQPGILLAPLLVLAFFMAALGPGMLCGALNVRYRDVGQIIPFVVQTWMFMTPVIYPVSFVPERYRPLLYLNPMTGPVEAFRASVLGHTTINAAGLLTSLAVSAGLFFAGVLYFRKVERTFADII